MAQKKLSFDNPLLATSDPTEKKNPPGRPRKAGLIRNEDGGQSSQEGMTEDLMRFSVICKVSNVNNLKDYAFTKRITIKDAMDEILEAFFTEYRNNPKNEKLLDHTRKGRK